MLNKEEMYREVGANYRFFLGWRHAAFAGYLVVLGAVTSLCLSAYKDAQSTLWLITLAAFPIGILFWWIDYRNRDLYHAASRIGKALETPENGFYTYLCDQIALPLGTSPYNKFTQTGALNALFFCGSAFLAIMTLVLFIKY